VTEVRERKIFVTQKHTVCLR